MGYHASMDLNVTAENDARFRESLGRAIEERLSGKGISPSPRFNSSLLEEVPLADFIETVRVVEGEIAKYDMAACMRQGRIYSSTSMKRLARWLIDGGSEEARGLLRVMRDRRDVPVWPLAEASVSAEYLEACMAAGVYDTAAIAQAYTNGIAVEFLISAVG